VAHKGSNGRENIAESKSCVKMAEMKITQFPEEFKKMAEDLASTYEAQYHGCSQAVVAAFVEILGISDDLIMAASCFAGGCTRCLTCGAISGALIVLGMKYGRRDIAGGLEALLPAFEPGCEFVDRFKEEYGTTDCCELVGRDLSDPAELEAFLAAPEEGEKCIQRVKKVAGWVAEIISKRDRDGVKA